MSRHNPERTKKRMAVLLAILLLASFTMSAVALFSSPADPIPANVVVVKAWADINGTYGLQALVYVTGFAASFQASNPRSPLLGLFPDLGAYISGFAATGGAEIFLWFMLILSVGVGGLALAYPTLKEYF